MTQVPPPLTPGLDDRCPNCRAPVGDHTIRRWGKCLEAQGLNYHHPYAEVPGGPLRFDALAEDQIMVGGIDVAAGVTETDLGRYPVLCFRFYAAGVDPGSRVPTPQFVLVADTPGIERVAELVAKNAAGAIEAAG